MGKRACFVSTISATMKCFIVPIAHELAKEGVDVTLVCNKDETMFPLCEENGIKYHPVHMGRGIDKAGLKAVKEIMCFLKAEKFDLVQYCTPNAACYTSIAAILAKIPIRLYCQWGIRYVGLSGLSRNIFKLIEKIVCSLSTNIRAVSWKNRDFAVSEGLYKIDKAQVVGNGGTIGVDMSLFDVSKKALFSSEIRAKYDLPEDAFVFGFCGRLSRDKGSNELIAAFRNVSENYANARLLVVGDIEADTGVDEKLFKWAEEADSVIFTGKISEAEVHRYYAPMDCLVHPTYREGFGMVIQEAGAYAIPCITTRIPGASEVMVDNESCLLVESKDTDGLEASMMCLLDDKQLAERLGQAAYLRTKKLYDRPVMIKFQKEDYLMLLGEQDR